DSVLGEKVNFGAGTTTSNLRHDGGNHTSRVEGGMVDTGRRKFGTIVGDGVHTGINTSIYPGRKLWPGTSTLPGEIVRKVILKSLVWNSRYVWHCRIHRKGGCRLRSHQWAEKARIPGI